MKLVIIDDYQKNQTVVNCGQHSIMKSLQIIEINGIVYTLIHTENKILFFLKNPKALIKLLKTPKKTFAERVINKAVKQIEKEYIKL